jgi:hypothetical protein
MYFPSAQAVSDELKARPQLIPRPFAPPKSNPAGAKLRASPCGVDKPVRQALPDLPCFLKFAAGEKNPQARPLLPKKRQFQKRKRAGALGEFFSHKLASLRGRDVKGGKPPLSPPEKRGKPRRAVLLTKKTFPYKFIFLAQKHLSVFFIMLRQSTF